MKPLIKDTPKEDKPPNKGQAVNTLYRTSPLKEDNLSTKDKTAGPEGVLIKRFHCRSLVFVIVSPTSWTVRNAIICGSKATLAHCQRTNLYCRSTIFQFLWVEEKMKIKT